MNYFKMHTLNNTSEATARIITKSRTATNRGFESLINSRFQLGYVLSGEKCFAYNEKCIVAKRGDLFFIPIGNHYIEDIVCSHTKLFEQIIFSFSSSELNKVLMPLNLSLSKNPQCREQARSNSVIVVEASSIVRNIFTSINEHYNLGGFYHNEMSEMINLTNLLHAILEHESEELRCCIINSIDQEQADFERVIYDNIFSEKCIDELAHEAHRSLTSFKKEFKRLFQESPHRWYLHQRMNCAKMMLATTDDSISHISSLCTFNNTSHFIKLYKCYYGMTPAQHRKVLQGGDEMAASKESE